MKNCIGCKYAEWDKTKTGRLSPTGFGKCQYKVKIPTLPESMYWLGWSSLFGGSINRKTEFKNHCSVYVLDKNK